MIYVPPVDPADYIMQAGDEITKCINKYFGDIPLEEAANPEVLDPKYSPDEFPATLYAEYYRKLEIIWSSIPTSYHSSFQAAYKAPGVETPGSPESNRLREAYAAATRISFWEKISKSNHEDVEAYKAVLKDYCEHMLVNMHHAFVDACSKLN